ncbi:SCO family protein [Chelatococcus sp. SYSU_G07232]|uniref:SCO family protein n=1 Tax=Chelatococcus albus TaxID=3047466 RepID=A0ABT7AKC5_9HYPH|nr:SCO family protein [Chelatococcus sp. SYSU_G07232]MDJ1159826.1 SCO family protein [Chelatococcus sp. SYSU_G07232]
MRKLRIALWGLLAAAAVAAAGLAWQASRGAPNAPVRTAGAGIAAVGGPFRLTTHEGKTLSSADLAGRPFAVFFGFTHCPDVCPTTLFELSEHLKALGPRGDDLRVLFITVDPERDTRELLATYLSSFDPRIIGLTGTREEIDAVTVAYKATYMKVRTSGDDYTMNHTASVYLMDARGRFVGVLDYQEPRETQLQKLRRLVAG